MARTVPDDWIAAGFVVLRERGHSALTIDSLCKQLKRTKGAFYHHFAEFADYRDSLLARWEQSLTEDPIAIAECEPDPFRRQERLAEAVRGLDHPLDLAVRAWALRDADVRVVLDRVDSKRVEYLAELWSVRTGQRANALTLARLEYAAFVGAQQLYPDLSARTTRTLDEALSKALQLLASSLACGR
jgi:AcrR family transcriptional regulator